MLRSAIYDIDSIGLESCFESPSKVDHGTQLPLAFEGPLALLSVEEIYERASVDLFEKLKEDRRIERKSTGIHQIGRAHV